MGRPSKNQLKSTGGIKEGQVKYSDPRMAYCSTKKEMVVKESTITMNSVFGDVPCANSYIVVCEDHLGYYLTSKNLLDVSILDPYRNYKRNKYTLTKNEDDTFKVITEHNVEYVI
jgi:hypothetical protein